VTPSFRDLLEARSAVPLGFSPGGEWVLVGSTLTGTRELYRVPAAGGELEQLTDLGENAWGAYLPDGRVLVSADEGGNERHQLYVLGESLEPLVVEPDFMHLGPCASRDGALLAYACNRRNRVDFDVYVRELASGSERPVLERGGMCVPMGFSPDGGLLAVFRLTERTGDNELLLVDLARREVVEVAPHEDESLVGRPWWLPDGSAFFFATSVGRDVAGIARWRDGAWEYVVQADWDLWCSLDGAGRRLLVETNEDGYSRLELRDPATLALLGEVPQPGRGVTSLEADEVHPVQSPDGRLVAFPFTSSVLPGDVWVHDADAGGSRRLTKSPARFARDELVEPELHHFPSFDGESVPVFLWEPRGREGRAPVLVLVHGGPEAQERPLWSRSTGFVQYLVASGWAVAAPNVRGSTGYGKRYEHLDDGRLRLDSVRDLAALHGWLAGTGRFDTERAVLFGGSYGGYMTLAGLAFQPELWAAGISVVGISSFVTFLGNTAPWRRYYREREYGSLERDREFLVDASPLTHVDRIRAPLFLIHGANDPRVPLSEAEQLHAALRAKGVPCELLVYPDEGHGLKKVKNRLDAYPKALAFLESVLGR
jgi:dipeptidyl aminopeptidase/acylaminoacyl peptidase